MSEKATVAPQPQTMPAAAMALNKKADEMMVYEPLQAMPIQRKLSIGAVDDPLENEADAMADKIMRMPINVPFGRSIGHSIQRKCNHCEEEENDGIAQRKPQLSFIQKKQIDEKATINNIGGSKSNLSQTSIIQRRCNHCEEEENDGIAQRIPQLSFIQRKQIGQNTAINNISSVKESVFQVPFLQRKCSHCEAKEKLQRKPLMPFIQRKSSDSQSSTSESVSQSIQSSRGNGEALSGETKQFMEGRFGADFSGVTIHTDAQAANLSNSLNAQAFTVGQDIYFNSGKFSPNSNEGKHLLAHELTHTVQQDKSGSIKRKTGDISIYPSTTWSSVDESIQYLRYTMAVMGAPMDIVQVMVINGIKAQLYSIKGKENNAFEKKLIESYTIKPLNLPPYYLIGLANNKLAILGTQDIDNGTPEGITSDVLIGGNANTKDGKKIYDAVNKELTIPDWFTNDKDRKSFDSKVVNPGFAVIVMHGGGGVENVKPEEKAVTPPMPKWMGPYQEAMRKMIKEVQVAEPKSTDLPDTFSLYYSRNSQKWRASSTQPTTDPKKPLQVYFDIDEKDDKKEKFQEIRDKIRIRQLEGPTTPNKDSKPLDPALDWAYRMKLELDVKIAETRKSHPGEADLPDKTGIVTKEESPDTVYLKLSLYITTKDAEGNPASELKTGLLASPLVPHTNIDELFEAVKKATMAIRGNTIKAVNENPTTYKTVLVPFPATIEGLNIRDDYRSVTGAELEMYMNVNTSGAPGMDILSETQVHYRGIMYTWDVYRISEIIPPDDLNKMPKDWSERRKQLQGWFKNSKQLEKANPVLKEDLKIDMDTMGPEMLRFYREFGLTYGLKTSYDSTGTISMPKTEGEYVIYARALAEPSETTFRLPSEAFFTVNLIDGYKLAEGVRDERLNAMERIKKEIADEKDPEKKKDLQTKLEELEKQEKRTLLEGTDYNIQNQNDLIKLVSLLKSYYQQANATTRVTELIERASKRKEITDKQFDDLLKLWKYVETNELDKKPIDKLTKMITDAQKSVKQMGEMKERVNDFSDELKHYKIQPAPVVGLVSKVTGQVYPLLLTIGKGEDLMGRTHVRLVDVTTEETKGWYEGISDLSGDKGYEEAVKSAFEDFGHKCKYGEGYIAYRIPGTNARDHVESAPGTWEKVKRILSIVAAAAGIAALIIGTVLSGGLLGVVAGYIGIGAMVIGAGLAIDNIYDRAVNHRLHADVELAMDLLNIAGPVFQGIGAVAKLSQVATLKSLVNIAEATGDIAKGEKGVLSVAMLNKLGTIVRLQKTVMIIQKAEAITNIGLIAYKTSKDLSMVAEVYADDPKKVAVMQAEIMRNALLSGTFAVIALHSEFKIRNVDEIDALTNNLMKERDYESAMLKSGLKDAEGNWRDPKMEKFFLGKEKEDAANAAKVKAEEDANGTKPPTKPNEPPGGKHEPDQYEKDRKVNMKGHAETPDKQHDVEAYPDGSVGRCSATAGERCPILQLQFKETIQERPILKKELRALQEEIGNYGENVPKPRMEALAKMEQRMRLLDTVRQPPARHQKIML